MTETGVECNKPAVKCVLDLKKAFERVRLGNVVRILQEESVPTNMIQIIKEINTDNVTK